NLVPSAAPTSPPPAPALIQNPHDLLGEGLRHMTPQRQAELLDKAAEEALRLQSKAADNRGDLDAMSEKIDMAARAAREAAANSDRVHTEYTNEHRSKQGDMRITIRTLPEKSSPPLLPDTQVQPKPYQAPRPENLGQVPWIVIGIVVILAVILIVALKH